MADQKPIRKRGKKAKAVRRRRKGFTDTEKLDPNLIPVSEVEEILSRYGGGSVPLEELHPHHAMPPSGNALMDRSAAVPARQQVIDSDTDRIAQINTDEAYRREHKMQTMHVLLLRSRNMQQIASLLDMDIKDAYTLRRELYRRFSMEAGNIDMLEHSGKTIAFYDEIRTLSMRNYDAVSDGTNEVDKLRWLGAAMAAENNKHRFFQATGFYKVADWTPAISTTEDEDSEMTLLREAMKTVLDPSIFEDKLDNLLDGEAVEDDIVPSVSDNMKLL